MEQGDLNTHWKLVSKRVKEFQKSIVLPIGSLSIGLCRHRAVLFKVIRSLDYCFQVLIVYVYYHFVGPSIETSLRFETLAFCS